MSSRFSFYKRDNVDNEYKSKLYELNILLNPIVTGATVVWQIPISLIILTGSPVGADRV